MDNLLEHLTDREVDDKVGGTVDNKEEIANTDKNRNPDRSLTATTGVKELYFWVENIFR